MVISRLKIENFRSIKSLDMALSQQCALVGQNNAGKSNILEALRRVLSGSYLSVTHFSNADIYGFDPENDIKITCEIDPPIKYNKLKNADPVDIHSLQFVYTKYIIGDQKGQPRLEQTCLGTDEKQLSVMTQYGKTGNKPKFEPLVSIPSEVRDQIPLIYIGTNRSLQEQLPSARWSLLRRMFEDVNSKLQDPSNKITITKQDGSEKEYQRAEYFQILMQKAMKLLRTDEFIAIEQKIKDYALKQLGFSAPNGTESLDLYFTPLDTMDFYKSLDIIVKEASYDITARSMGEGLQNALVLAILQAYEATQKKGAIILIEEPEMFLHPQMQRTLASALSIIAETNQVIYTTHSPHFVSVPEYDNVRIVRKLDAGTIVTKSSLSSDEKKKEKFRKELDPERNELFFCSKLILVEGDTEKLALPVYAKRKGIDLDALGISIVEVGGKRNIQDFLDVARSFLINVAVIYDEDSSDISDSEEELKFNTDLDAQSRNDGAISIWCQHKNYEFELRKVLGENTYQSLCQKFSNYSKPIRARLIASESCPVPPIIEAVLDWSKKAPVSYNLDNDSESER